LPRAIPDIPLVSIRCDSTPVRLPVARHGVSAGLLTSALILSISACGGADAPTEQPGKPGITIIGGADVTDTIDAILSKPLRVVVRDASGRIMPRTQVSFGPARVPLPSGGDLSFEDARVFAGDFHGGATEVTSDEGIAATRVQLGELLGPASLVIRVQATGAEDTAHFVVKAGARAGVRVTPMDSAFTVGGSLALSATAIDRVRHPVPAPEPLTFRAIDPAVSVSPTGVVQSSVYARARIEVSSGPTKPETVWVSVVPRGTFAARFNDSLAVMAIDGSGRRFLATAGRPSDPEWSADGLAVFARVAATVGRPPLYRMGLDGSASLVLPGAPTSAVQSYVAAPIHSWAPMADGSLLAAVNECGNKVLYRFSGSGASAVAARISPQVPYGHNDCYDTFQHSPWPSPDGTRVVYQNDSSSYIYPPTLEIRTIATGALTPLNVVGERPRWSAAADLIAYYRNDQLWVVRPDGSGKRVVSPPTGQFFTEVSWSPDGRWLLARANVVTSRGLMSELTVIEVATQLELPLHFTLTDTRIEYGAGAWSPVP